MSGFNVFLVHLNELHRINCMKSEQNKIIGDFITGKNERKIRVGRRITLIVI